MGQRFGKSACAALLAFTALAAAPAYAQRAGESAVDNADDAFGTRIGNESLGLYSAGDARGFSPQIAGNVRIEGLYFDQQPALNERLVRGSAVRVGISAQSYAFPAPTGIADYRLRLPGDKMLVSGVITLGPNTSNNIEIDGQFPLVTDALSVGIGLSRLRNDDDFGVLSTTLSGAALLRWRAGDAFDSTAFYSRSDGCKGYGQPQVFTVGPVEPPHPPAGQSSAQPWQRGSCTDVNFGAIGSLALPGDWLVRAGLFRSTRHQERSGGELMRFVNAQGIGEHTAYRHPPLSNGSYSGEVRIAKTFNEGPRRHTLDLALRGRDVKRDFGGSATVNFGFDKIYTYIYRPEPAFAIGPTGDDHSKQGTVGLAYDAFWAGVGGIGVDVQKTFYHRQQVQPAPSTLVIASSATPLLYSAAGNVFITRTLAAYASYTKGFEETGPAPQSAVNRGEAQPVSFTKQIDAGLRYNLTPTFTLVAGVFQVEKPYFTVDTANRYGLVGNVRHRGIEFSATGQLFTEGLRAVAGFVLIEPRISGAAVDQGLIGPVEVQPKPRSILLSLQYQPKFWNGFGIDGSVNHSGPQFAHTNNDLKVPATTLFNLGARYNFNAAGVPASLRFQVQNVTDVDVWSITFTGCFCNRPPRRYLLTLAADF